MQFLKKLTVGFLGVFLVGTLYVGSPAFASVSLQSTSDEQEITSLQTQLVKMGYLHVNPTGQYGLLTQQAVKNFQHDVGLTQDGVVGPGTYVKINNVEKMAHVVYGEARGEVYEGQVAVAAVILNRAKSPDFPQSIPGVISQPNAFTALNDGQYALTPNQSAYRAVTDAFKGWDPTNGAVYYYNPITATNKWIFTRKAYKRIGSHVFAY
ncbi:cell wall hydrolase [Priestia megaterium]|uniref:cell wall hydrolase n=1 Tax=Priestia megaterium TaxID=1404 RepID=UPI001C242A14|nr:cell wall hydrolase [Priestia megaterium]MBU8757161.1 cell wall hydrolase [Priestia megaterium]